MSTSLLFGGDSRGEAIRRISGDGIRGGETILLVDGFKLADEDVECRRFSDWADFVGFLDFL